MPDLKAAAKRLRNKAKQRRGEIQFFVGMEQSEKRIAAEADDYLLAAQALEALAWQAETGARVRRNPVDADGRTWNWACDTVGDEAATYYADTPFGALLAAMEGEKSDT